MKTTIKYIKNDVLFQKKVHHAYIIISVIHIRIRKMKQFALVISYSIFMLS